MLKYFFILIFLILSSSTVKCQLGKSLVLNGCTDFLEIQESDLLDYNDVLSIECWIAPNCDDSNRIILGKEWCVGQWSYYLSVQEGKLHWRFSSDGGCVPDSHGFRSVTDVIPTNSYTHVAVVHDQTEIILFVNGQEISGEYISGSFSPIFNGNEKFRIGAYKNISGTFGNYFSGLIDDIRVWSIPLTEAMIQSNMNNSLSGNENGLILYLDMESADSGPDISLNNQANIAENLTAFLGGFTSLTPYFTKPSDYFTSPLNFEDQYHTCNDVLDLSLGNNDYKSIMWSTGSQSNSISISNSGTYSITIETDLCKKFSKTFDVFVLEQVFEEENIYICSEDSYEFQGQFLSPNTSTEFILSGMFGCDTILTINVFEFPKEEASFLGNDITSCKGIVTLISPYENTVWNENFVSSELSVDEEGVYIAVVTDDLGCIYYDSISVTFELLLQQIAVAICKDDFYIINGDSISPNSTETYTYETSDGCDSTVIIQVLEVPQLESSFLGNDIISCMNPFVLQSPFENTLWNDGINGFELLVTEEGVYYALASDELGCTYIDSILITFEILTKEISVTICKDEFYSFNGEPLSPSSSYEYLIENDTGCDTALTVNVLEAESIEIFEISTLSVCQNEIILSSPFDSTFWENGLISKNFKAEKEGFYYAEAHDDNGCLIKDTIFVEFINPNIYLPNVISKKSRINNCFKPTYSTSNIDNYTLTIFDRWGNLIFSQNGPDVEWCGYNKGKFVENGVYVYVLEFHNTCNSENRKIGTLTVI